MWRARALGLLAAIAPVASLTAADALSSSAILQELRSLRETGTVLYVAAHPDDENTRLIAWLARGRGLRTGYLSVTRGDGGQNLIGSELREGLGVIRTQELLAARHIDGAEQFFTRAVDFGYSKTPEETLAIWDRQAVLLDIVRVLRTLRPDVIITRFSPRPGNNHGHHVASAKLALEAFALSGDPNAFPQELAGLTPWQPRRVLWNAFRFGAAANAPLPAGAIRLEAGGYHSLLGESYGEIAARSRSMHKSQGFGMLASRAPAREEFQLLAGEPVTADIMDGVDTTWGRIPGGAPIGSAIETVIAAFDPLRPDRSTQALLKIRRELARLDDAPLVSFKRGQLDRIITACLGLYVETTVADAVASPGQELALKHTVVLRAGEVPVRWQAVRYPATEKIAQPNATLTLGQPYSREATAVLPPTTPLTQPHWLRSPGTTGLFQITDPALINRADTPPVFPVEHVFSIEGQEITVTDQPVKVIEDPVRGEVRHPLAIVAPASLQCGDALTLFAPGGQKTVTVELTARRAGAAGTISLVGPAGWTISPAQHAFTLAPDATHTRVAFAVTAPREAAVATLQASAVVDGVRCVQRQIHIQYEHIPPQLLQPEATTKAVSLDVEVRARTIGYLPGAGDAVAEALLRLGCTVTWLNDGDVTLERLRQFDAVVLGIRAFNTRNELPSQLPALFGYAAAGGTVVVQYNTTADLKTTRLAPYPLRISRDRVADENAAITLLAPEHRALRAPNRITEADFAGWVQERGLYFPNEWDEKFTPLLGMNDPGESATSGALLVAPHDRGWYVYTGLSFFRQLPEGVPGAYRLLANLVSLGK